MTTIDFMRHGEPVGGHRYRGHVMQTTAAHWYRARVDNSRITRFQHTPRGDLLVFHNSKLG